MEDIIITVLLLIIPFVYYIGWKCGYKEGKKIPNCVHEYDTIDTYKSTKTNHTGGSTESMMYVSKCKKCGDLKKMRVD